MKSTLTLLCIFLSTIVSANVSVDMTVELKGKKRAIVQKVKLEESQNVLLKDVNLKLNYIVSNKKPANFPNNHIWTEDSISLKAEIFDLEKNEVIASPQITTIYGEKATMEMSESEDMSKTYLKIEFNPKKL